MTMVRSIRRFVKQLMNRPVTVRTILVFAAVIFCIERFATDPMLLKRQSLYAAYHNKYLREDALITEWTDAALTMPSIHANNVATAEAAVSIFAEQPQEAVAAPTTDVDPTAANVATQPTHILPVVDSTRPIITSSNNNNNKNNNNNNKGAKSKSKSKKSTATSISTDKKPSTSSGLQSLFSSLTSSAPSTDIASSTSSSRDNRVIRSHVRYCSKLPSCDELRQRKASMRYDAMGLPALMACDGPLEVLDITGNRKDFVSKLIAILKSNRRQLCGFEHSAIARAYLHELVENKPFSQELGFPYYHSYDLLAASMLSSTTWRQPRGLWLEFGVGAGRSTNISIVAMRRRNVIPQNISFYGFDWFRGYPEDWVLSNRMVPQGAENRHGIPPPLPAEARLVEGRFQSTLGPFLESKFSGKKDVSKTFSFLRKEDPVSTVAQEDLFVSGVNVDSKLYAGTYYVLQTIFPYIRKGTLLHFHDCYTNEDVNNPMHELLALVNVLYSKGLSVELVPISGQHESAAFVVRDTADAATTFSPTMQPSFPPSLLAAGGVLDADEEEEEDDDAKPKTAPGSTSSTHSNTAVSSPEAVVSSNSDASSKQSSDTVTRIVDDDSTDAKEKRDDDEAPPPAPSTSLDAPKPASHVAVAEEDRDDDDGERSPDAKAASSSASNAAASSVVVSSAAAAKTAKEEEEDDDDDDDSTSKTETASTPVTVTAVSEKKDRDDDDEDEPSAVPQQVFTIAAKIAKAASADTLPQDDDEPNDDGVTDNAKPKKTTPVVADPKKAVEGDEQLYTPPPPPKGDDDNNQQAWMDDDEKQAKKLLKVGDRR